MRERFFTPRLRFKSYEEMNAWLLDRCVAHAKAHPHPEMRDRTVWSVFEAERPALVRYAGRFDGFHSTPAAVSKTCLVRFDNNKYSVPARAVGRPVEIQAYADHIVIRQDGEVVAEHVRRFSRDQTIYDPWHYVPVLARKPGALRNGAPFRNWVLPGALGRVRAAFGDARVFYAMKANPNLTLLLRLRAAGAAAADGDRQMVDILSAVLTDGLAAVEAACGEALSDGVQSSAVILNILARRREASLPGPILTPAALRLQHEPAADCARYDSLRSSPDGAP